jgi:hypothetical protein
MSHSSNSSSSNSALQQLAATVASVLLLQILLVMTHAAMVMQAHLPSHCYNLSVVSPQQLLTSKACVMLACIVYSPSERESSRGGNAWLCNPTSVDVQQHVKLTKTNTPRR